MQKRVKTPSPIPYVLDCHNYYELMVAQSEGRSPMTSSDAGTDSKPIIIIIIIKTVNVFSPALHIFIMGRALTFLQWEIHKQQSREGLKSPKHSHGID